MHEEHELLEDCHELLVLLLVELPQLLLFQLLLFVQRRGTDDLLEDHEDGHELLLLLLPLLEDELPQLLPRQPT